MIIYKITNTVNSKGYVGQTRQTAKARFSNHKSKAKNSNSKALLHEAMREYGSDAFTIEVLEKIDSEERLNEREKYWIQHENTLSPNGYNETLGGDVLNCHFSHGSKTKNIMRAKKEGMFAGKDNPFYGKHHTEETKKLMHESAKSRVVTDEWKANIYKTRKRKPVVNLDTGEVFVSARHACRYYGKNPDSGTAGCVAKVCRKEKKYKTVMGYHFEYYDPVIHDNTVPSLKFITEEGVTTIRKE